MVLFCFSVNSDTLPQFVMTGLFLLNYFLQTLLKCCCDTFISFITSQELCLVNSMFFVKHISMKFLNILFPKNVNHQNGEPFSTEALPFSLAVL